MITSINFKHYGEINVNDLAPSTIVKSHRENEYIVSINNKQYTISLEVLEDNTFLAYSNGLKLEGSIQRKIDSLIKELGFDNKKGMDIKEIPAPMPGMVLSIAIQAGQHVEEGDALLTLEAMKMENIIKSPSAGIVKSIEINAGDPVEKNQIMIVFE